MSRLTQFLKFYLLAALVVGGILFIISILLFMPEIGNRMTAREAILFSAFNGAINGLFYGLVVTVFLTILYYIKARKVDKHNKRVLNDPS